MKLLFQLHALFHVGVLRFELRTPCSQSISSLFRTIFIHLYILYKYLYLKHKYKNCISSIFVIFHLFSTFVCKLFVHNPDLQTAKYLEKQLFFLGSFANCLYIIRFMAKNTKKITLCLTIQRTELRLPRYWTRGDKKTMIYTRYGSG